MGQIVMATIPAGAAPGLYRGSRTCRSEAVFQPQSHSPILDPVEIQPTRERGLTVRPDRRVTPDQVPLDAVAHFVEPCPAHFHPDRYLLSQSIVHAGQPLEAEAVSGDPGIQEAERAGGCRRPVRQRERR